MSLTVNGWFPLSNSDFIPRSTSYSTSQQQPLSSTDLIQSRTLHETNVGAHVGLSQAIRLRRQVGEDLGLLDAQRVQIGLEVPDAVEAIAVVDNLVRELIVLDREVALRDRRDERLTWLQATLDAPASEYTRDSGRAYSK